MTGNDAMKIREISLLATLLTLATATAASAASVNEPYAPDARFNNGAVILDPFIASTFTRITGQKLVLDEASGDTVIAGLMPVTDTGEARYIVVVARYGPDGKHKLWANGSVGAVDASKKYVYVPYNVAPGNVRAVAVRDVSVGSYGDVSVLVDTRALGPSASVDSVVATFGPSGEYKGVVTHMAQASVDDVGAKIVANGSGGFVVSSQPDIGHWASGAKVVVRRYTINLSNGVPAFDTSWGNGGKVELALPLCSNLVSGIPPIILPVNCDLRVERVDMPSYDTTLFIAGDYENRTVGGVTPNRDLFVMKINMSTGALVSAFGTGGIVTYGSTDVQETLRGLATRRTSSGSDLYLLEAFPRACGNGFIVPHFNGNTGAYINRSFTMGGGGNADPNVCGNVDSLLANDMAFPRDAFQNGRYLGVVGTHIHAEPYTGTDAFLSLLDIDDLHATPQLQDFTRNAGQYPGDSAFSAVVARVSDNTFMAAGTDRTYEGDVSTAMTLHMRQDRIFRGGFEG